MSKHYIIHGLDIEIFYKDLPEKKSWSQYKSLCLALRGDGWRAPTLIELRYMYELHILGVGNFLPVIYWSSDFPPSISPIPNDGLRSCINFGGSINNTPTDVIKGIHTSFNSFRPVRSINI